MRCVVESCVFFRPKSMLSLQHTLFFCVAGAACVLQAQQACGFAACPSSQLASTRHGAIGAALRQRRSVSCLALRSEGDGAESESSPLTNELALRILITQNRSAREAADRAYIPMDVAVRWVRTLNLWDSREKWEQWIEANSANNPFIPENPEEYYSARGVWLGWRYWLGGE